MSSLRVDTAVISVHYRTNQGIMPAACFKLFENYINRNEYWPRQRNRVYVHTGRIYRKFRSITRTGINLNGPRWKWFANYPVASLHVRKVRKITVKSSKGRRRSRHKQSILFHYDYPRQLLRVMVKVRHLNVISCRRQGAYLDGTAPLYTWCNYNLILFPGRYKRVYFMASFLRPDSARLWLLAIVSN